MRESLARSSRKFTDFQDQTQPRALERRSHRRYVTRIGGYLRPSPSDQALRYCDIIDVSANGARIRTTRPLTANSWVTLGIERLGRIHAQVVWQKDNLAGVQFAADPGYVARRMRGIVPVQQAAA
jgi:hypothetical protein